MNVYLDYNASTPIDERVLEAMLPYLRGGYGNPSSLHRPGREARAAVERAREQVAALAGTHASEVVFTSGGTEADNLAVKGMAARLAPGRVLISGIEHPAVLEAGDALAWAGWRVESIAVQPDGRVDVDDLQSRLADGGVRLVAVMAANNETGVIQPLEAIAQATRAAGARLHVDAVQAAGKAPLAHARSGADTMALSGHKIHGPKGVGALLLDKGIDIEPLAHGGGHENGLRAGTLNTPAIVGFGAAAELAAAELEARAAHMRALREQLENGLRTLPGVIIFGEDAPRLPNTCQFALPGYAGETLLMALDRQGVSVSSGSACASGSGEPSHVLLAMGVEPSVAGGAIRMSLGKDSSAADVDAALQALQGVAGGLAMPGINPAVLG